MENYTIILHHIYSKITQKKEIKSWYYPLTKCCLGWMTRRTELLADHFQIGWSLFNMHAVSLDLFVELLEGILRALVSSCKLISGLRYRWEETRNGEKKWCDRGINDTTLPLFSICALAPSDRHLACMRASESVSIDLMSVSLSLIDDIGCD